MNVDSVAFTIGSRSRVRTVGFNLFERVPITLNEQAEGRWISVWLPSNAASHESNEQSTCTTSEAPEST